MKKSEAFKKAAVAVLDADMPISVKKEIIEVLMWEQYFQKIVEDNHKEAGNEKL
jgi:hypothetical protein